MEVTCYTASVSNLAIQHRLTSIDVSIKLRSVPQV